MNRQNIVLPEKVINLLGFVLSLINSFEFWKHVFSSIFQFKYRSTRCYMNTEFFLCITKTQKWDYVYILYYQKVKNVLSIELL